METAERELEVRTCGAGDRALQAELFNQCFKKRVDASALAWRYDESPHGRSASFVTLAPDGRAVSGYACSPRLAVPGGNEAALAPIGETGDVMTHPDWRGRGLFSTLDRRCMEETGRLGWPVVFGLPNRRSAHIFVELGWREVGAIRPWTLLLRGGADARAVRLPDGRLAAWLAPLGALRARRARARLAAGGEGLDVRPLERFPGEVAELSGAVEPRFALMVRRDAAYLNWRFLDNPSGLHRALGLYRGHALAGYVVVQAPRAGESVGYLVDALAPEERVLGAALEAGLATLAAEGCAAARATAVDGSFWSRTLRAAGFLPPRPENHLIVIAYLHDPEHPLAKAALDASAWYLTDGDRDDETMG